MDCQKCGEKIKRGDKVYKQPYHKTCYEVIRYEKFEKFLVSKGYVEGERVEGENLLTQTSRYGTIIAVRPWAQAHEAILVEWDGGGEGSYPWNYLKLAPDAPIEFPQRELTESELIWEGHLEQIDQEN